ncbi:MAG: class I SAM-dependent methyltransferase [Vicinamibacterales bacterium]
MHRPLYAPWQPGEALMREERRRVAVRLLHEMDVLPGGSTHCLEVGVGTVGWLPELLSWGVAATALHGIDIDADRLAVARSLLPVADLRLGTVARLPWPDSTFGLVVASTTFTSILDGDVRLAAAREIDRVLAPGGALLWYDFAQASSNPGVRAIPRSELASLFPCLHGPVRRVTLAPPLARLVAPRSWLAATALSAVPWLRTHLIGVLVKDRSGSERVR